MTFTWHIRDRIQTAAGKKAYNQGLFTRVAAEYDAATWAMSLGQDRRWKQRLVQALPDMPAPRCLDLACGTGDVTMELARKYPRGEIIDIDLTHSMLEVARTRNAHEHVRFLQQDMSQLEFSARTFDVVTGSYALRNAPVLAQALTEVTRVLRPGGWAAFLDFSKTSSPRWQGLQLRVLKCWGGFWGLVIHGGPEHAYIAESLRQYPDRDRIVEQLAAAGLHLRHREFFMLGFLELLVLQKPFE